MNGSERTPERAPAEVLREAARLMRERAEAAQRYIDADCGAYTADGLRQDGLTDADAEHFAGWQPAVALAVAALLDMEAEWADQGKETTYATDIARAYLGTQEAPDA